MEAIGQKRDKIPEHMARAREAMKQQQRRRVSGPGLAIEDLQPVHVGRSIPDGSHCISPRVDNRVDDFGKVAASLRLCAGLFAVA
jgi:hypothetical protein